MSQGAVIIGKSDSRSMPHKKCVIGINTYYVCRYPEGDYCIHRKGSSSGGYGGYDVEFLMEDGAIEVVPGPFRIGGSDQIAGTQYEAIADAIGVDRQEFCKRATRIVVGSDLIFSSHPKRQIAYEETEFTIGDWRERLKPEWIGLEVCIWNREIGRYLIVEDALRELEDEKYQSMSHGQQRAAAILHRELVCRTVQSMKRNGEVKFIDVNRPVNKQKEQP